MMSIMNVGDSVRLAIDDWERHEPEAAMLHACNAVDGTAGKLHPSLGNKARFTRCLRDSYPILGPMGAPGINVVDTRFPVTVQRPSAPGGEPDLADVIYGVHRCTHGHGDELPDGFDLIPDASGPPGLTQMMIERGKLRLSDRIIFGLLAVAVLSPVNRDQRVPDGYFLAFADTKLAINDWWGRGDDFAQLVAAARLPNVTLDLRSLS
jgi:hypothetical protein